MAPGEEEYEDWPPEEEPLAPEEQPAHPPEIEFVHDEFAGVRQRPPVDLQPTDGVPLPATAQLWEIKDKKPPRGGSSKS